MDLGTPSAIVRAPVAAIGDSAGVSGFENDLKVRVKKRRTTNDRALSRNERKKSPGSGSGDLTGCCKLWLSNLDIVSLCKWKKVIFTMLKSPLK